MKKIFGSFGFLIPNEKVVLFEKYYSLLVEYNDKFNITAITKKDEVVVKHFIDSIVNCGKVNCGKLIDIGSGGGFPAIPLKIMNDDLDVTLLEATGKKCDFLNVVINELGLKNIRVINGRAEEFAFKDGFRETFDYCSARAVARLNVLSEYCLPFVKVGGTFISYKGDASEELNEAQNAITILGGKVKENFTWSLDGAKRALIYIEKIKNTDKKYPRSNGKIRKSPL